MLERRETGKEGDIKVGRQEGMDAAKYECRNGRIQERRDSEKE